RNLIECPVPVIAAVNGPAAGAGLVTVGPVRAGATLTSRATRISADGIPGDPGGREATAGTFSRFAADVGTGGTPSDGVISLAHQYSAPGLLGASGAGLEGAFGEGEVRADVIDEQAGLPAVASSRMELNFRVEGGPVGYKVGAAVGATGGGTVSVLLAPAGEPDSPVARPVDVAVVGAGNGSDALGRTIDETGFLAPGDYVFRVSADAADAPEGDPEGRAYFTFNFQLTDTGGVGSPGGGAGGPPTAIPLPSAGLTGGGMLGLLAVRRLVRTGRRRP
ncbi:MAG: hypothetical protein JWO31_2508, partial [Phycisphaerales bacterium]|nr:hypothetical protein [Phycisphaerales bacterium]